MTHPSKNQFDIDQADERAVTVLFMPTQTYFCFSRVVDPDERKKVGPLIPSPEVRHGPTGDTGDYWPDQVEKMAYELALKQV